MPIIQPFSHDGNPLRFAIIGDRRSGGNESDWQVVNNLVNRWEIDLILTSGDNFENGESVDSVNGMYSHWIGEYQGAQPESPTNNKFWPVMGNHDSDDNPAAPLYLAYFAALNGQRYYRVRRGPVEFFMVNSGVRSDGTSAEPDGYTSDSAQAARITRWVAESSADWKIAIFHHPPYTSTIVHGPGLDAMRWDWPGIGVDLVISGHSHGYERFTIDGFNFIVNGAGGATLHAFGTPLAGSVLRYNDEHGAMLCFANRNLLRTKFINVHGATIDTLELTK